MTTDDKWTEERVLSMEEESFYFERKSGGLLDSGAAKHDLAKEVCAFANSEGGTIVLGVEDDDGSFSGVDPKKGNGTTKDWIGNLLKDALAPQFQRFHVREVVKAEPSQIPEGKILLVIEVEKSENAPHQVVKNGVYYHRVDKESVHASHAYVQGLFSRQTFPGPVVGNAWVQTVINPAITTLENEGRLLRERKWGSDSPSHSSLHCVKTLNTSAERPNVEQFFLEHGYIFQMVVEHDERGRRLVEHTQGMYNEILRESKNLDIFNKFTSTEFLQNLKSNRETNPNGSFDSCVNRADFLQVLRMEDDPEKYTPFFVDHLFENSKPRLDTKIGPLWHVNGNFYRNSFETYFDLQLSSIQEVAARLSTVIEHLIIAFRTERTLICRKYGLPYDPMEIVRSQQQSPNNWNLMVQ